MFDDLKEKIGDFISSVRSKLPGSKSNDDEEYDDEFDEKTEEINLKDKVVASAQNTTDSDEEDSGEGEDGEYDDEEEEDEEDEAKAKKQKVMRLGLVGLVLILGLSILMEDGEEDNVVPPPNPVVRKKKPKRKAKNEVVQKKVEVAAEKEVPIEKKEAVVAEEKSEEITEEASPSEDIAIEEPSAEIVNAPEVETTDNDENTEAIVVENELKLNDDVPEEGPETVEALGQSGFDSDESETPSNLGEGSANIANQGNVNDNTEMSEAIDNLTDSKVPGIIEKVVKAKLEYQEPPNYQETGRGLVYNCTGKHWACVDQVSYIDCKKNHDWSKENEKSPECYNSNVYQSFKDCRTIQIYNINTNTETEFCN